MVIRKDSSTLHKSWFASITASPDMVPVARVDTRSTSIQSPVDDGLVELLGERPSAILLARTMMALMVATGRRSKGSGGIADTHLLARFPLVLL